MKKIRIGVVLEKTEIQVLRPLQNSSYNLSFLNIFCTFMV
ncbi:hypothetical protein SAMN02745202_00763 [Segatella oulorum]|uniref:Uncharacterized protein n=2 Tax=Segatella oulorum TaxID=28136 RepID=G1WDV6_9BACT|nr:hypothetical protein HMPREF9431_02007 [Segatella oulorum F0390]SJZ66804.1 hypothetical protein SAMN02745202_00763 [Segatella oulorum]